jgi:hypothetical protein
MDKARIHSIFFQPPLAVARLGGSDIPLPCFVWDVDTEIAGAHRTIIRPTVSLEVMPDGSVLPYLPAVVRFRDGHRLRPVAPFFELWAGVESPTDGSISPEPLTLHLLARAGASLRGVQYTITVANRKAQRRTGSAACALIAHVSANGADHQRKPLRAVSPHNADEEPLVSPDRPIPLGHFQVIRPVPVAAMDVDLSVLRVRFTPAHGEVYGPPSAVVGPASPLPPGGALAAETLGGRLHEIVPEQNRILNPNTPWSRYMMNQPDQRDPQPSDSYDGANVGDNRSWGVVDDTCDGVIRAELVVGGERHIATTRVLSTCPDFAPDRRPFYSFADDLADRDLDPAAVDDVPLEQAETDAADLFRRIFEVASLMNLDATRVHGIEENEGGPTTNYPGLPAIDEHSMTEDDMLADKVRGDRLGKSVAGNRLPYTDIARDVHAPLTDIETLLDLLRSNRAHVERLIRPPFGRFHQLKTDPGEVPDSRFRDPRVRRDTQQDMRMPPYMRDSDETPLSLTWRQYAALMRLIARLADGVEVQPEGGAPRPASPLARRVAHVVERIRKEQRQA